MAKFDYLKGRVGVSPASTRESNSGVERQLYGKRAREDYTQLNSMIPADLKLEFRKRLLDEGITVSQKVEELIRAYIDSPSYP